MPTLGQNGDSEQSEIHALRRVYVASPLCPGALVIDLFQPNVARERFPIHR